VPLNYGIPAMSDLAPGSVTDVSGIELGHATDESALAGCTVVLCRAGAIAGSVVRGLAQGTSEMALVSHMAAEAVALAVLNGIVAAEDAGGLPAACSFPPGQ